MTFTCRPRPPRAIIEALLECIRRHGLAGATAERVAEKLGVSRTLVFNYFGDTEARTRGAAEQIFETTLSCLMNYVRTPPTAERGRAILDFFFQGHHLWGFRSARSFGLLVRSWARLT